MRVNGPGQSSLLLLDLIDIFQKQNIPYAIIGALAASFYGVIRASIDADALVFFDGDKAKNLIKQLKDLKLHVVEHSADFDDPVQGVITIQDNYNNQVDLLQGIKGMEENIFSRVMETLFHNVKICVVSVEDFIAMKIFAGSFKDIEDVKGVLEVSQKNIDIKLLKDLTQRYGREELQKLEDML